MRTLKIPAVEIRDRGLCEVILMDYLIEMPGTPQSEQMKRGKCATARSLLPSERGLCKKVQQITLALFDSAKGCYLHNYGAWERELLS